MSAVELARAGHGDAGEILALDEAALGHGGRAAALRASIDRGQCWIARSDGALVGFAVVTRAFFGQPFIEIVVVAAPARRRGVATALVHQAEVEARAHGRKLFTSTNQSNAAMHAFCAAAGFVKSGVVENLDEDDPEIIYFKPV